MELLEVYYSAILVGALMAAVLSILGAHLASRDKALQSLTISQAATTGVLAGVVLSGGELVDALDSYLPPLGALVFATLVFGLSEKALSLKRSGRGNVLIAVFTSLLALGYGIIAYFPQLESHMAQAFFGDLVTLSGAELWTTGIVAGFGILFFLFRTRTILDESFSLAIFGPNDVLSKSSTSAFTFNAMALLIISVSVYGLGLLYTIAALFIPTVVFSFVSRSNARTHLAYCASVSTIATIVGFSLSLTATRVPTVPAIVAIMLLASLLGAFVSRTYVTIRSSHCKHRH